MSHSPNGLRTLLFALILVAVTAAGCSNHSPGAAQVSAAAPAVAETRLDLPQIIDAATVDALRSRDDVVVLDVREDWEFAGGHVPGALWLPLGELANRTHELPQDKTILAVCRSGNRSGQATEFLANQGFAVHNMAGGMIAWEQAGLPIE
jgi:rhodanese-related sulfurtransferase